MAGTASERVPVTFTNDGPYPMTIGTERVQPGASVQHIFRRGELPASWRGNEIHVALTEPEADDVRRREPLGIIELSCARAARSREP